MQFLGFDAQGLGQFGNTCDLLAQQFALFPQFAAGQMTGNESSIAVPPLKKPLSRQPFVDAENRILIDRQFRGQHPYRWQALARLQRSASALGPDLRSDLPCDRHSRRRFHANPHGSAPGDYTTITVFTGLSRGTLALTGSHPVELFRRGAARLAPAVRRLILAFVQGTPPRN